MSDVKIKGTSINDLVSFVEETFPNKFDYWISQLPECSREIFHNLVLNTNFYDLECSHIEPIKILAKTCFDGDVEQAAYELGKYGSKKSLGGIYSIFIQIPSREAVVKKASTITATYFQGIKINVIKNDASISSIELKGFSNDENIMIANIAGWIDNMVSIITHKSYKVTYSTKDDENGKITGKIIVKYS